MKSKDKLNLRNNFNESKSSFDTFKESCSFETPTSFLKNILYLMKTKDYSTLKILKNE